MSSEGNAEWHYTRMASEYAKKVEPQRLFEELVNPNFVGRYQGRKQIHRDSRINKGVYLTASPTRAIEEACVVDDDESKQPELLACYRELRRRAAREQERTGAPLNHIILDEVFEYVQETLPYDLKFVEDLASSLEAGRKVALATYINYHAGVCRHQALLAGYLLEKLVDDKVLHGKVSVERNIIPGEGGHSWARYKNSAGDIYILDPAQDFIGTLEESERIAYWDYRRPEEIKRNGKKPNQNLFGKIKGLALQGQ